MPEFFSDRGAYVVLTFAAIAVPFLAGVVGYFWHKTKRDEQLASLKHAMLERAMSADEIEKVIEAGTRQPSDVDQTLTHMATGQPAVTKP
jgi:hypothetical protein